MKTILVSLALLLALLVPLHITPTQAARWPSTDGATHQHHLDLCLACDHHNGSQWWHMRPGELVWG